MSIKKYIQIILAVIGCVFLFTGCMTYCPMEIAIDGLPEGSEICVLLKSDIKPEQPMRVPDALKGTELEGYEFDGWKPFFEYERVYQDYNGKTGFYEVIFQNGASAEDIRAFCEIYQELRLAVTDKNKKIQYVTSVLDLTPSYRFGYPQEVTYDVKTDSFSIKNYVSNTI